MLLCSNEASAVSALLSNYTDYSAGAPLTVIALDKVNENSVADSYAPLFPPTQAPNLFRVNNLSEFVSEISLDRTINFCLDSVPWLELQNLPYHRAVWHFYLIGGGILATLLIAFAIIVCWRMKTRRERQRQIEEHMQTATTMMAATNNSYEYISPPLTTDVWEISVKSLDIHYKVLIGKGAFSIVHTGFLHGRSPVLNVHPSISLQEYINCEVAVKTLPQHYNENDKALFLSEIRLMKDIGFHIHLVSMLGCNCSIARPLLVLELAEQSLLHWLIYNSVSIKETETNLEKILLSISWQISDGMNYLSSKNFVHRDLAARNVLLNKGMKAMVSDFGLCHKLEHPEQVISIPGGKLPLKWLALESLQQQQFSSKTDVWSFGVLLYEIFNLGQEPYLELSSDELLIFLRDGNRLDQPRCANKQMYDFMKHCWKEDAAQRPDFARIQGILRGMLEDAVANYGYLSTTDNKIIDKSETLE